MVIGERLFDACMYPLEVSGLRSRRRRLMRHARGRVLEVGAGTGANLDHYRSEQVEELHLLDLWVGILLRRHADGDGRVRLHEGDVQSLPFADDAFDTVVSTLVFCSVQNQTSGLAELWRVLKPGGRLVFMEHVRPEGPVLGRAADAVNPLWHAVTRDCNINRDTLAAIRAAGFTVPAVNRSVGGLLIDGVAINGRAAPSHTVSHVSRRPVPR